MYAHASELVAATRPLVQNQVATTKSSRWKYGQDPRRAICAKQLLRDMRIYVEWMDKISSEPTLLIS